MAGVKISALPVAEAATGTEQVLVVQDGATKKLPVSAIEGPKGDQGATGYSAYQVAVSLGFAGSEAEWLASLVGPEGDQGEAGPSAYELAVANGFEGTIEDWLANPLEIETALLAIAAGGNVFDTKAAMTAGAGTISEGDRAVVLKDESQSNHVRIYRKVAGVMTLLDVPDLVTGAPNSWGGIGGDLADQTDLKAALDALNSAIGAKAGLASPDFTGNPTAPTQAPGNNTTRLATTAFVTAAISALIAAAPGALDTLDELAAALGDDANFASTMTTALAGKLAASGGMATNLSLTGTLTEDIYTITDGAGFAIDPTNGSMQQVTLGANRTPTVANFSAGQSVLLRVDDGTARTLTWTTLGVVWVGGSAPTLATTGWTYIVLWRWGSTYYGMKIGESAA